MDITRSDQIEDGLPSSGAEPRAELMTQANSVVRSVFGHEGLRDRQKDVLQHVLAGRDCIAVLPTGGGKSLCYVIPAMIRRGIVLVVSPLVALIRDQAQKYSGLSVPCVCLHGMQSPEERDDAWRQLSTADRGLLLVSPERLSRPNFRERLAKLNLQLAAIDEAHCISHWGRHFRPEYRYLGDYLDALGGLQKIALTATAPSGVRREIEQGLDLHEPACVLGELGRENLEETFVRVSRVADQFARIRDGVVERQGSGIVYAPTRKNADEVARMLADAGVSAAAYHAGRDPESRKRTAEGFRTGAVRVVAATSAFGMGIDKADIRFVHHFGLPASPEQYLQEIGRAGRDGDPATCLLVWSKRDYYIRKYMIEKSLPETPWLRRVFEAARASLAHRPPVGERGFLRHLADELAEKPKDLRPAVELLAREGLVTRYQDRPGPGGDAEILIGEGAARDAAAFWLEYGRRRGEKLARLDAMYHYVTLESGGREYLQRYFEADGTTG